MITVITGTPGAGKTLYTIQKLLLPLLGTHVPQEVDGVTTLHPRTIYTNIKGLTIDHEFIDGGDEQGLRDWHEWAKPGAVIVFDEVQKIWSPRANGSAVPPDIQALETHRHMGVDFILITQNVMLVDRNIHALGGRHLHIRRVANMPFATVYEWDHVNRQLLFAKAITKSPYKYNKKVFKLYHSADLHTKQPRKMPGVLWFIVIAIGLLVWKLPDAYRGVTGQTALAGTSSSKPVQAGTSSSSSSNFAGKSAAASVAPGAPALDDRVAWVPRISSRPESAPAFDQLRQVKAMPVVAGALCNSNGCRCVTQQGTNAGLSDAECKTWLENPPFDPYSAPKLDGAPSAKPEPEKALESRHSPTLVVIDGPGWRDPVGARASAR